MPKHSLAVAYSMKKKKKASGGTVDSGDVTMNLSKGGQVGKTKEGKNKNNRSEFEKGVFQNTDVGMPGEARSKNRSGMSDVGEMARRKSKFGNSYAASRHLDKLDELKEMPSPKLPRAHGGEVIDGAPAWVCSDCGSHSLTFSGHQDSSHELDMIGKALEKRRMAHGGKTCPPGDVGGSPMYSKGGQVANDEEQGAAADELPNEFDDLVLRDDEEMEGYSGANSGDDIGGPSKSDVVSKAMLKRKKK